VGWRGRSGDGGTNQVRVNWIDHEVVRTSMDPEVAAGAGLNNCNATGDFWIGSPAPITTQSQNPVVMSRAVAVPHAAVAVFDMLGRQLFTSANSKFSWDGAVLNGVSLKRGVYFVQVGNGANGLVTTHKLTIDR
jgi:hypothetical protein